MAPMASRETWEKVCAAYAEQLEEEGQYYKAASYFLACHKVCDAIEMFQRHNLYREAISLAKVRLSPIDPTLETLYQDWGTQLLREGHYEQSAKCYIAMKQVQEAGKIVAKRHDLASLKTACQMNLIISEQEQALTYAHRALSQHLLSSQWKEAYDFLNQHEHLKVYIPVVCTHELLVQQLTLICPNLTLTQKVATPENSMLLTLKAGGKSSQVLPDFFLEHNEADPVVPWEPLLLGLSAKPGSGASVGSGAGEEPRPMHTFPHHLLHVWHGCLDDVSRVTDQLKVTRAALDRLTTVRTALADVPNLILTVSMDVTSCLLALMASETSAAIHHLLQAFSSIQAATSTGPACLKLLMPAVCRLMLPQGPKYLLKLQQEFRACKILFALDAGSNLEKAGGESCNTIKRFLTELRLDDDTAITTASNRCRELDCLRAFYYLGVLDYIQEAGGGGEMAAAAAAAAAEICEAASGGGESGSDIHSGPENDSLDGEPKSEGSSAGSSVSTSKLPEQAGKLGPTTPPSILKPQVQNLPTSSSTAPTVATAPQDSSVDPQPISPHVPSAPSSTSSHPLSPANNLKSPPTSPAKAQRKPSSSPIAPPRSRNSSSHSPGLLPMSPKRASSTNPHILSPPMSPSRHITSISSSPQGGPRSTVSSPLSASLHRKGQVTKHNLLRLSKGLLWDVQAKGEVLTETLGYIHRAISQHLLANRGNNSEQSTDEINPVTPPSGLTAKSLSSESSDFPGSSSNMTASTASSVKTSTSSNGVSGLSLSAAATGNTTPSSVSSKSSDPAAPTLTADLEPGTVSSSLEADGSVQPQRSNQPSTPASSLSSPISPTNPNQTKSLLTKGSPDPTISESEQRTQEQQPSSPDTKTSSSPKDSNVNKQTLRSPQPLNRPATARSLSESHASTMARLASADLPAKLSSTFDCSIGLQAERDLLGDLAGEPITFSKSKKVLWEDKDLDRRGNHQSGPPPTLASQWAEAERRRVAMLAPDGSALPLDWDDMPVDVKFSQGCVTLPLLRQQQEAIVQELRRGPDLTKLPFPPKRSSISGLLEVCMASPHLSLAEKRDFIGQLRDWASLFAVTSHQKTETDALFNSIPKQFASTE